MAIAKHYRLSEVARQLDVTPRTLRNWIKAGKIKAAILPGRFGAEYRIAESELRKFGVVITDDEEIEAKNNDGGRVTCQDVRDDGQPCRAPAVNGSRFCRHHPKPSKKMEVSSDAKNDGSSAN